MPNQRSFFTDGHVFKGVSVTVDALKDVLIRVSNYFINFKLPVCVSGWLIDLAINELWPNQVQCSAIAGDSGPNVRSAKIKINASYPWILNIYDPCHNLNLYLKDLGKLFKDVSSLHSLLVGSGIGLIMTLISL